MPHLFIVVVDNLITYGNFPCSTLIFSLLVSWAAELVLISCIPLPSHSHFLGVSRGREARGMP